MDAETEELSQLRTWRISANLTLVDAAKKVGVTHPTWLRWETGALQPSAASLRKLVALTGLSSDIILGLSPDPAEVPEPNTPGGRLATEGAASSSVAPLRRAG